MFTRPVSTPTTPTRASAHHTWLLATVLLLALGLRLWGITWQLPEVLYYDELKYVLPAAAGLTGQEDDEPTDFRNPSLFRHLLGLEYRLLLLGQSEPSGEGLADRAALMPRMLAGRLTVVLFAVGSVALLYLAGRLAFGPPVGLLAGALLAVNFLHVHLSHFALNDVPACFFMIGALLVSVSLLNHPDWRGFALAGLLGGLAAATKYNFGVVLLVPLAVWVEHAARRTFSRDLLLLALPVMGIAALAGFVVGMPELLWSFDEVRDGIARQARLGDRRWPGQAPDPIPLLYGQTLLQAFGLPALLAAVAGVALLLYRRSAIGFVLVVCALVYLVYMSGKLLYFARFALPLVPFICLFAAYALVRLWSKVRAPSRRVLLGAVTCALVLMPPALLSVRLDLLASRTDTRLEAQQWLLTNAPPGVRVATQRYTVPITFEADWRGYRYLVTQFDSLVDPQRFSRLACEGHAYLLTSSFQGDRQRTIGRGGEPSGYELLAQRGQLVATFWPGPDSSSVPLNIDDVGLPFWEIERYARPGPTIRVYALPPGTC